MKKTITIVGGGSCALMLGCILDNKKFEVNIYERNNAIGRKFLVAGDGGFNLTHSEPEEDFISRYTPFPFLEKAFRHFSNKDFINWINQLGIETYVGSSGRVFPKKGIKPIDVLTAFLTGINNNKVTIHTKYEWKGFSDSGELLFKTEKNEARIKSDITIFCLGGASWPVTGSKGDWLDYFVSKDISVKPFEASNCSFKIEWPQELIKGIEGKALKNCHFRCGTKTLAGEVVLTRFGIEGSGIYPLSPEIRSQLASKGTADLFLDLKPTLSEKQILEKLKPVRGKVSYSDYLAKQLNLNPTQLLLLKKLIIKDEFLDTEKLVQHIKNFRLSVTGIGPVEEAISTVGGICLNEITGNFELKKLPGIFAIGEMLDYDAPTGGYLLQSCFTMAKKLGDFLNSEI